MWTISYLPRVHCLGLIGQKSSELHVTCFNWHDLLINWLTPSPPRPIYFISPKTCLQHKEKLNLGQAIKNLIFLLQKMLVHVSYCEQSLWIFPGHEIGLNYEANMALSGNCPSICFEPRQQICNLILHFKSFWNKHPLLDILKKGLTIRIDPHFQVSSYDFPWCIYFFFFTYLCRLYLDQMWRSPEKFVLEMLL